MRESLEGVANYTEDAYQYKISSNLGNPFFQIENVLAEEELKASETLYQDCKLDQSLSLGMGTNRFYYDAEEDYDTLREGPSMES